MPVQKTIYRTLVSLRVKRNDRKYLLVRDPQSRTHPRAIAWKLTKSIRVCCGVWSGTIKIPCSDRLSVETRDVDANPRSFCHGFPTEAALTIIRVEFYRGRRFRGRQEKTTRNRTRRRLRCSASLAESELTGCQISLLLPSRCNHVKLGCEWTWQWDNRRSIESSSL